MPTGIEGDKRVHSICFTGHRPETLTQPEEEIISGLEYEIGRAISDRRYIFFSGMARGVDIWAAEIVLRLHAQGKDVQLVCACPYEDFEQRWSSDWQKRYHVEPQRTTHDRPPLFFTVLNQPAAHRRQQQGVIFELSQ